MEKRLVMAFVFSFLILYVWAMLIPRPNPVSPSPSRPMASVPLVEKVVEDRTAIELSEVEETITHLESSHFYLTFSNIGAKLAKIDLKKYNTSFPVSNFESLTLLEQKPFQINRINSESVEFFWQDEKMSILRKYTISDDNIVQSETTIKNRLDNINVFNVNWDAFNLEMSILKNKNDHAEYYAQESTLFEYSIAEKDKIFRKGNAIKFSPKENKTVIGDVKWMGFRNRYFCVLVRPNYPVNQYQIQFKSPDTLNIQYSSTPVSLEPNDAITFSSIIYAGPQDKAFLKKHNHDFEKIMSFSGFGLVDAIAQIIYSALHGLRKFIPSWGICIILISVTVYLVTYPLTIRSMSSMKKMQAVQPKVNILREKHKNNPQKLNKEMIELYREYKINPLGGCLPMILQMPVFIGLYQVLWRTVSLKDQGFLWIKDLAAPDRLFVFPFELPFLGNEFNILPVIMAVAMAFQQKLSSQAMPVADSAQAAQQKMMAVMFPIILGFVFYKFASGLTLYFTMFYLFSAVTQWKMLGNAKLSILKKAE